MSFELKLALKYFCARRKSLARFTSIVAVVGIAAGVASLIVAQSLARGFADEMRDKILANTSHISIFLKDGKEIFNQKEIEEKLKAIENIREVTPTAYENSLIIGAAETSYAIIKVQNQNNLKGSQISVGARLAEKLNLKPGDSAEIVTLEMNTPSRVSIAATFETGLYDYDSTWIYVSPEKFAQLHGQLQFTPTILSVSVKDIYASGETARKIRLELGENFKVVDWQEANRPLFAALSLERKVTLAIISLIIFIAALNITTTLALLVNERRLDIAILRTSGARTSSLISIFLLEGLFLGFTGIFFGVAIGLFGCLIGNYFRIISLPAEVYSLSYIPLRPEISNILLIIFIAVFLCSIATLYPALKASRIKPLENLRTQ
ncbi:MAG TPA: ABC transporter permease [Pyrinomonadaceae bacterium]|jgi:lipoprotein-releasing system permease protein|nr:ABC transporter permease [Pyrinomonadaceae bacterium]